MKLASMANFATKPVHFGQNSFPFLGVLKEVRISAIQLCSLHVVKTYGPTRNGSILLNKRDGSKKFIEISEQKPAFYRNY